MTGSLTMSIQAPARIERDISLAQAARLLGRSRSTLRAVWHEIPSAYVTEGGRCYVDPSELRTWRLARSQTNGNREPDAV